MTIQETIAIIERFAPLALQEKWDNSGLQVGGDTSLDVSGMVLSLDITHRVLDRAIESHSNLVVSHHPLLFDGVKNIVESDTVGSIIWRAIKNEITIYALHTPADSASGGINDFLANTLGLNNIVPLEGLPLDATVGMGRVGDLRRAVSVDEFGDLLRDKFSLTTVPCSAHRRSDMVQRVALCGGSGGSLIATAIASGADVFVCGDLKYHDFQRADNAITLYDIGHYNSEICFVDIITNVLQKEVLKNQKKIHTFAIHSVKDNFISYYGH
ncbi:MAG: Nif3-like dinuclear metal center hexameric protein [Mucinivorans sp.]